MMRALIQGLDQMGMSSLGNSRMISHCPGVADVDVLVVGVPAGLAFAEPDFGVGAGAAIESEHVSVGAGVHRLFDGGCVPVLGLAWLIEPHHVVAFQLRHLGCRHVVGRRPDYRRAASPAAITGQKLFVSGVVGSFPSGVVGSPNISRPGTVIMRSVPA